MTQKTWRDVLPVHPAADLFPMMNKEELLELGNDIKKNGQLACVVLREAEKGAPRLLLDGRNRLDAEEAVGRGIDPRRAKLEVAIQRERTVLHRAERVAKSDVAAADQMR